MKYIIDIPEEAMMYLNVWEYKDGKCVWADSYLASDLKPYTASESYIDGLRKGQKEVWDFVRIITDMTECERKECFGGSTCDLDEYMTYQEAKTKYDEWKKKKDEIRVGDEVEQITASGNPVGLKCVVTKIVGDEILKGRSVT